MQYNCNLGMSRVHRNEKLWQDRVTLEVEKIKQQLQNREMDDRRTAWRANREGIRQQQLQSEVVPPPDPALGEHFPRAPGLQPGSGARRVAKVSCDLPAGTGGPASKKQITQQQVNISLIAPVEVVPKQTQWAPIQRNILAEDEQYSNIPFFGDDVIDKDSAYIRNFTEEVNANSSLFREVDEKGFVSLVEYLSKYDCWTENNKSIILRAPSTELQREWGAASYKDRRLPGLVVFQAIASKYSDSGSVDELIKKYKSLTKEKPKNNFVVNIDAAEAGPRDSAVPVERALETYKTLMCRRCFLYDCPLHNDKPVESAVPRLVKEPEIPPPSSPCGPTCFLQPSAAKPSSSGGPDNSARFKSQLAQEVNPLSDITGSEQDAWTGSEVSAHRLS